MGDEDDDKKTAKNMKDVSEAPVGRRYTCVGTAGYKAPELINAKEEYQKGKAEGRKVEGYGASVDWWSFGVLVLEMLAGFNPYAPRDAALLGNNGHKGELGVISSIKIPSEKLPNEIKNNISNEAKSFVDGLLATDPKERLGTNKKGSRGVRKHPFFAQIDFDKMLCGELEPPFKMKHLKSNSISESVKSKPQWESFKSMKMGMEALDVANILGGAPIATEVKERHQRYFKDWEYVAPSTFKLELGLQERRMDRLKSKVGAQDESADLEELALQNEDGQAQRRPVDPDASIIYTEKAKPLQTKSSTNANPNPEQEQTKLTESE